MGKTARTPIISKSSYLSGLQCHKLLWHLFNAKEKIPKFNAATQAIFDQGAEVGRFARTAFSAGVEVGAGVIDLVQVNELSTQALQLRKPLFEVGFIYNNTYARADILVPVQDDEWDLVEVKSSTEVKDYYLDDVAEQKFVYEGAGLTIRRVFLQYVNSEYIRQGNLDNQKFFVKQDVTDAIQKHFRSVATNVEKMHSVIAAKQPPATLIGPYCDDPNTCPLHDVCWKKVPEDSIFTLTRLNKEKAFELYAQGYFSPLRLPKSVKLTEKQSVQVETLKKGKPYVDRARIRAFLNQLKYPLYYLDFETFATPLPKFDNVRPYQAVPFQFSLHVVKSESAEPKHHFYLAAGQSDPRPEFLRLLESLLGDSGSIVAYNATFEETVLRNATEAFPQYAAWYTLIEKRFVDLLVPFRDFSYYHPSQHGSTSIKYVLPVLTEQSYKGKPIADGGTASREYLRVTFGVADGADRDKVRSDLESYCHLDTLAMILLIEALRKLAGS